MTKNLTKSLEKLNTINNLEELFNPDFLMYAFNFNGHDFLKKKYGNHYFSHPDFIQVDLLSKIASEASNIINNYSHSSSVLDNASLKDFTNFLDSHNRQEFAVMEICDVTEFFNKHEHYEELKYNFKYNYSNRVESLKFSDLKSFKKLAELTKNKISSKKLENLIKNSKFFMSESADYIIRYKG